MSVLLRYLPLLLTPAVIAVPTALSQNESEVSHSSSSAPPLCLPNGVSHLTFPVCTSTRGIDGLRNIVIHGMACTCDLNTHDVQMREDYHYTVGIGAHKLHTIGATFNNARKICIEEGAHLAIIDSLAEEQVLLTLFGNAIKIKSIRGVSNHERAFIGIHDLFSEGDWVTVLGDSLHKHAYAKWSDRWGGQPDNGKRGGQNCGTLLKDGGMDDESCNAQYAFFCEIPGVRIVHSNFFKDNILPE